MALLEDISTYLDAQIGSLTVGTNLFLGRIPDSPDVCVTLFEYAGGIPVNVMGGDAMPPIEQPRIQAMTRHTTYSSGRALAINVWQVLEGILNETLSGTKYHRVSALQNVFPLDRDSHNRILFVQNFQVIKAV